MTCLKAFVIIPSSLFCISSSCQKYLCISCTHSKYETTTPPAFARISGSTNTPWSLSMASASRVVGSLAPSATILAFILFAFFEFIWPPTAAGMSTSHLRPISSSTETCSASLKPASDFVSALCFFTALISRPF